ncbi:MAG: nodulation protein NfeD [Myxococcota bacterium]
MISASRLALLLLLLPGPAGAASVYVLTISGGINPAVSDYIQKGILQAEKEQADVLVIEMDTPGGLLSSTKDIVSAILNAEVPVVVYVSPKGAYAASAGMFITLAGHVAAMAPGTSIGAAHPVSLLPGSPPKPPTQKDEEGEDPAPARDVMSEKIENFAAAFAESIAEERNRNVEWAIAAVRESVAITQSEAVEQNVVDLVAEDLEGLLAQLDGWKLRVGRRDVVLSMGDVQVTRIPMGLVNRFFDVISDPQIALLLILAGLLGLYVEFTQPGLIAPGVAGVISLILAGLALQIIPFNWLGLILILLGVALLIAEIFVTSFGVLFAAGMICFALGGYMIFDVPEQSDLAVPVSVVAGSVLGLGIFGGIVVFGLSRALFRPQQLGAEGLIGQTAVADSDLDPEGRVFLRGDLWTAEAEEPVPRGEKVQIVEIRHLTLRVRRAPKTKEEAS